MKLKLTLFIYPLITICKSLYAHGSVTGSVLDELQDFAFVPWSTSQPDADRYL